MIDQKDRKFNEFRDMQKEFSKPVPHWLAQYEEEDDFLCGKVSNALLEFSEDE